MNVLWGAMQASPLCAIMTKTATGAEGGSRTHTRSEPQRFLRPPRLPFRHPGTTPSIVEIKGIVKAEHRKKSGQTRTGRGIAPERN